MNRKDVWQPVELDLRRQKTQTPNWPVHVVAQAAVVNAEAGQLLTTALNVKYSNSNHEAMQQHAISTIAKAIRFLENLEDEK